LHNQPLRGSAYVDVAVNVAQFKIAAEGDCVKGKWEIMVTSNFLMDNKTDINAKGFAWISHG
jgi:hypothetical protein